MAFVLKDRVKETSTTTGTGTFTLAGAATGFQSFSVIGNTNTVYYAIVLNGANEWEIGLGTYTSSGTSLSRDTILESSNSGSKVNFSAGTKEVFCTYPAEKAVTIDDVQTLSNKTLASPSVTGSITFSDASTQNTAATGFGFKNRIINGAMMIDQRGTATTPVATSYSVDRWQAYFSAGTKTLQQVADAPTGFTKSLKVTTTSASAGSVGLVQQWFEGNNVADFNLGTANAVTFTLSFWVKSSVTGTFAGDFANAVAGTPNRSYVFTYTINTANTWEYKTVTVTGDTTGTWATDNTAGLRVLFNLGTGGTSATAGSWQAGDLIRTSTSVGIEGTLNATWQITGVQLEKGSTATSFDYRPYGTELALCQRYYIGVSGSIAYGYPTGSTDTFRQLIYTFPVAMRTAPTVTGITWSGGTGAGYQFAQTTSVCFYVNSGDSTTGRYLSAYAASSEL